MTDDIEPGAVVDARITAKGLLPKHLLVWLLVGFAAVLTLVSAVTNVRASRAPKPLTAEHESTENPRQLESYRTQLDADAERARAMAREKPPAVVEDPKAKRIAMRQGQWFGAGTEGLSADQPGRERTSLMAPTMVVSRHPVAEGQQGASGRAVSRETLAPEPTLDETVAAVLKASRGPQPTSVNPLAATTGNPVAVTPDAVTEKPKGPVRTPPISAKGPLHLLLEGTVLDATLVDKLEGSNESPVKALISGPVYSHNRQLVLIPDGAFALGKAKAVAQYNETRLAVAFHRLELPDGSTVSLDQHPGLEQAGEVGLKDKVNNHYLATFGRAAAVGMLQGLGQSFGYRGIGGGNNSPVIIAGDAGNSTSSAFNTLLNRMPLPTVEIRAGHRLHIYLTSDLELPAWSRVGESRPIR